MLKDIPYANIFSGTLTAVLLSDMANTALHAAIGVVVSFVLSLLLKSIQKKLTK
jgi:uncharacterized membrane protein